jgi:hypothetical protein
VVDELARAAETERRLPPEMLGQER